MKEKSLQQISLPRTSVVKWDEDMINNRRDLAAKQNHANLQQLGRQRAT